MENWASQKANQMATTLLFFFSFSFFTLRLMKVIVLAVVLSLLSNVARVTCYRQSELGFSRLAPAEFASSFILPFHFLKLWPRQLFQIWFYESRDKEEAWLHRNFELII